MDKSLIIAGNVVDGLLFYGPFTTAEAANEYGDDHCKDEDWVVGRLYQPSSSVTRLERVIGVLESIEAGDMDRDSMIEAAKKALSDTI